MNDALTQFLVDVTRGSLGPAFRADRDGVLAATRLEPSLREAIRNEDVAALWRAGAHPMALLYFSRFCGWTGDRYYACVADAEAPLPSTVS